MAPVGRARLAWARAEPSLPPCDRLQSRCAMPDWSRLGAMSPVRARGGSWSAEGPRGFDEGRVMSTGWPHRMQIGSQCWRTCLRHALYLALERGLLLLAILASHDAAEAVDWVTLVAGCFAFEPSGVGHGPAVFAGRGVFVGVVFPASEADDVLAFAAGFAAMRFEFGVHRGSVLVGRSRARAVARSRPPVVVGS